MSVGMMSGLSSRKATRFRSFFDSCHAFLRPADDAAPLKTLDSPPDVFAFFCAGPDSILQSGKG